MLIFAPLLIAATGFAQLPLAGPRPDVTVGTAAAVQLAAPQRPENGDVRTIVQALSGKRLTLEMRGSRVDVLARIEARDACSATLYARNVAGGPEWSRELKWDEIAWHGAAEDGRVALAFYDPEGRLPIDIVRGPADGGEGVAAAVERVAGQCQARHPLTQTVAFGPVAPDRPCYFPRQPELVLADFGGTSPRQAMLTLLATDRTLAELQLRFDLEGANDPAGDRSGLVLYYGADDLGTAPVTSLRIAVDGVAVPVRQSTAVFNAIRLRSKLSAANGDPAGLLNTIGKAREVTVTLLGPRGEVRRTLTFRPGGAVETARAALAASGGACTREIAAKPEPVVWSPAE